MLDSTGKKMTTLSIDELTALLSGRNGRSLDAYSVEVTIASLRAIKAHIAELEEQLRTGSLSERAPTQWAYNQASATIERKRQRIERLEQALDSISEIGLEPRTLAMANNRLQGCMDAAAAALRGDKV